MPLYFDYRRWMLLCGLAAICGPSAAQEYSLPLFLSGSNDGQEGFVRITNHSEEAGTVEIFAIDDQGERRGPVVLSMGANGTSHFNSGDLEAGNDAKGLSGAVGTGHGDWRLELRTSLPIEYSEYVRTSDGFLTSMHDVVPRGRGGFHVPIFNPASNENQRSSIRVVNPSDEDVTVRIRGLDDRGTEPDGSITFGLGAGRAIRIGADELEYGGSAISGSFGDGSGKWQLFVSAGRRVIVMNLLESPTGHLTNLSRKPDAGALAIPLFLPASEDSREGFARVINYSEQGGSVEIRAWDDSGREYGSVSLALPASGAAHFNSTDLEMGNSAKGIPVGLGDGVGDWRLEFSTELDVEVLAYIRTSDGFVTAMHDSLPAIDTRHNVPIFNPASNRSQRSKLRIMNPGEEPVDVSIQGVDDAGRPGAGEVTLQLAGREATTMTAEDLEAGADGLEGQLGDGEGKWQLRVSSSAPVAVMNLMESPTGHLTNLTRAGSSANDEEIVAYADDISDGIARAVQEDVNIRGPEGHLAFGVSWVDAVPTCRDIPRTFSFGWQRPPLLTTRIPTRLDGRNGVFVAGIPRIIPGPYAALAFGYRPAGNHDAAPKTFHEVDVAAVPDVEALADGWNYSRNADGEKHGLQIYKGSGGYISVEYFVDGAKWSAAHYRNSHPDGWFFNHVDGVWHGVQHLILRDNNDHWRFETYNRGVRHGRSGEFDNGQPDGWFFNHVDGVWHGVQHLILRDNNDHWRFETYNRGVRHGRSGEFDNGQPDGWFFNHVDGVRHGVQHLILRDNNDHWEFETWREGVRHGESGSFDNGLRDGCFRSWTDGVAGDCTYYSDGEQRD